MDIWYKDNELQIEFANTPKIIERYAKPTDTKEEKEDIKQYPYKVIEQIDVKISYKGKIYEFSIPKGFIFDGATINRFLWRIIGSNTNPEFLVASCVHDIICIQKNLINNDRLLSSKIFKGLLLTAGVPKLKANIMFTFVDLYQKLLCKW